MSDDELYRVLYKDRDGHEQLTAAMTRGQARVRAYQLADQGFTVGSVMGDVAARGYMHARHVPQYRGVDIPLDLRGDGVPVSAFDAWKRGVDAELDALHEQPRPATYRGITVPRECLAYDGRPTQQFRLGVDAALEQTLPVVEALHDDSPCSLDHHGYCQEHGLPGPIPCPDARARELLAAVRDKGGES